MARREDVIYLAWLLLVALVVGLVVWLLSKLPFLPWMGVR
jgi:hypothetical protein